MLSTVEPVRIQVATPRPYDVVIGRGLRGELIDAVRGSSKVAIVHPPTLSGMAGSVRDDLVAEGIDAHRIEIPDAEDGKALSVAGFCWEVLGRIGLDRLGMIIALGGGAVTDLGGFGAGTRLRGVRLGNVPTTLLGMGGAAIGGEDTH